MSKFILVTGASTGIGFHTAKALSKQGFKVITTVREEADKYALSRFSTPLICDLKSQLQIDAMVDEVQRITDGRLYGVFLNAAYGQPGALLDLSEGAFLTQLDVNLISQHSIVRKLVPLMLSQGEGRIVFNSSVLGITTMPLRGAYNASKHALEAYASTLRVEVAQFNIKVAVVRPGPIATNFKLNSLEAFKSNINTSQSLYTDQYQQMVTRLNAPPSPRTVLPEAVAKKVVHAFAAMKPKNYYRATANTYATEIAIRLLPAFLIDKMIATKY